MQWFYSSTAKIPQWVLPYSIILFILTTISPYGNMDIVLVLVWLFVIAHIIFKEKLFLFFIALRPLLDIWRDTTIISYKETAINGNAALSGLFILWALWAVIRYKKHIFQIPGLAILGAVSALAVLSALYSVAPMTSLVEAAKFIVVGLFFILGYILIRARAVNLRELFIAIACGAVVPVLVGVYQLILGSGITTFGVHGRIYGTFAHPNVFAFYVLSLLIIHIHSAYIVPVQEWSLYVRYRNAVSAILAGLIIATFTRGAWVGLVVFLCGIGVIKYRKLFGAVVGIMLLFYGLFFPVDRLIFEYTGTSLQKNQIIQRLTARDEDSDSIAWRRSLIAESIPIIAMRPVFGFGYGTFPNVWGDNRSITHFNDDSAEAHNDYLRLGLELGAVGLTIYALFLFMLFVRSVVYLKKHSARQTEAIHLLAWIVAFGVMSLGDNMLHHTPVMLTMWAWWGAIFALLGRDGLIAEHGGNFLHGE